MKKVLLLLGKGFEELEASVFTDVLGWSRTNGDIPVQLVTAGRHKQIRCCWSFTVIPDLLVDDVQVSEFDALAIPGGFEEAGFYDDMYQDDVQKLIRQFNEQGKLIASVCVGALPIGRTGILQGRKATTYHLNNGIRRKQLQQYGADVADQHVVVDGNIITSSCPATALEVAFTLLEKLTSKDNTDKVKVAMGFDVSARV